MAQYLNALAVLAEGPKGVQFWAPTSGGLQPEAHNSRSCDSIL